jgi:hypothetical protein
MEAQKTKVAKAILSKKAINAGDMTILDFKLYYQDIAIKTAWYWQKKNKKPDTKTNGTE